MPVKSIPVITPEALAMQSVLIAVHLMIVVVLVVVVLLQRSEGGALGVGGGAGFMTGRGQASALTRATAILAALYFATSMGLTILARYNQAPEMTFQSLTPIEPPGEGAAREGEGKGSLLDQLRRMEDQAAKPPALPPGLSLPGQSGPAAPAAPQGLNLPPQALPATPLVPQPAQTGPAAPPAPPASIMVRPAPPRAASGPAKGKSRDYDLPWSK
ncbi:MAG: preprotein translocase subunit SecG [Methylocella sp.]